MVHQRNVPIGIYYACRKRKQKDFLISLYPCVLCYSCYSSESCWAKLDEECWAPPQILIDSYPSIVLIDWHLQEILRCCWFRPTVKINPHRFLLPLCCSPSLLKSLSLSLTLSLSHSLVLFPIMFYLSWFPLNTRWFPCLIIIDRNKLFGYTLLFHFEVAHNSIIQLCMHVNQL